MAKREWSEEARTAAAQRMKARWDKKREERSRRFERQMDKGITGIPPMSLKNDGLVAVLDAPVQPLPQQAVDDIASVVDFIKNAGKITEVAVVPKVEAVPPMPEVRKRVEEMLVRRVGDEMVSTLGPCWCGAAKREWHKVH